MNLRVTARVLNNQTWHALLDVVVSLLELPDCCHSFDMSQRDLIAASSWLSTRTSTRAATMDLLTRKAKSLGQGIPSAAIVLTIDDAARPGGEVVSPTELRVHPLGALTFLCQPFHLLVEDEGSDGAFVLWMARLLGRDAVVSQYRAGRLLFRHAGGKGQLVGSAQSLTFGVWPRVGQPIFALKLRAGVLLDSDARFPGERPNEQIAVDLEPHVAFVHTLEGRAIENYAPRKYLRRRLGDDGLAPAADAFFRMTTSQQNHFPMKRGFFDSAQPPRPQSTAAFASDLRRPQRERDLYALVPVGDWSQLAPGFGERVASVYQNPAYRCSPAEPNQLSPTRVTELNSFFNILLRHL